MKIPHYKNVQGYSSLTKFTDPPKANPSAAQASQPPASKTKRFSSVTKKKCIRRAGFKSGFSIKYKLSTIVESMILCKTLDHQCCVPCTLPGTIASYLKRL